MDIYEWNQVNNGLINADYNVSNNQSLALAFWGVGNGCW